jgi:predicted nucleic acid-binding protein
MIFCDTSLLAKLYVPERESAEVRRLVEEQDEVGASELARTELLGVFHRRLRERKWTRPEFLAAVRQFSKDDVGGFWHWLPLDRAIVDAAVGAYTTLPETVFLRSSDCLHLVTAVHHSFTEIYTYDLHQSKAAPAFGIRPLTAG